MTEHNPKTCACGCGIELAQHATGRRSKWVNNAHRMAAARGKVHTTAETGAAEAAAEMSAYLDSLHDQEPRMPATTVMTPDQRAAYLADMLALRAGHRNPSPDRPSQAGERCLKGHELEEGAYLCGTCSELAYTAEHGVAVVR